ncbi:MAG: dCTP deaminase, partial [Planctomycetaceae bacterium]|nr:dCTP deaminase [Planctomycetaceae bacterium]
LEDDTEVDIENGVYVMEPGEFILAHTIEYVRVPPSLECVFNLKSSRGREGYQHLLAAYIDPGFHGQVTLELVNVNRKKRLPLEHGMRIGQLRFSRLDAIPMRTYAQTGRYHKDLGVQRSKG